MEEDFLMIAAFLLFTALPNTRACNPVIPGALSNRALLSLNLAPPPQYTYSDAPTYGQMPSARAAESNADKDLKLAILSTLAEHGIMAEKVLLKYQYSAPKLYLANGNNCTKPDTYVVREGAILYKCVAAPIRAKRSSMKSEDEAMITFKNTTETVNATETITEDPTANTVGITPESAANTTTTEHPFQAIVSTVAMMHILTNVTASSESTSTSAVTTISVEGTNGIAYNATITPEGLTTATGTSEIIVIVKSNETSATTKGKDAQSTVTTMEIPTTVLLQLKSKPTLLKATTDPMENTATAEVSTAPSRATTTTGATMVSSEIIMTAKLPTETTETTTTIATTALHRNLTVVKFVSETFKGTMTTGATIVSHENRTITGAPITSQVTAATAGGAVTVESRVAKTELPLLHSKSQSNLLKAQRAAGSMGNTTVAEVSSTPSKAKSTTGATIKSSETIATVGLSADPSEAAASNSMVAIIAPSKNKTTIEFSSEPSEATTMRGASIALSKNITTAAPIIRSQVTAATEGVNGTVESRVATTETLTTILPHSKLQPNLLKAQRAPDSMGNSTAAHVLIKPLEATPTIGATMVSSGTTTAVELPPYPSGAARTRATIAPFKNETAVGFSSEPSEANKTVATIASSKNKTAIEFSREPSEATTMTGATIALSKIATTAAPIITPYITATTEGATGTVGNSTTTTKIITVVMLHLKSQITAKSIGSTTTTEASARLSEAITPVAAPLDASEAITVTKAPYNSSKATSTTRTAIVSRNFTTNNEIASGPSEITTPTELTTESMQITATSHKTRSYGRAAAISNDSTPETTTAAVKQPVDMVKFQIVTAVTVETPQPIPESQWKMYAEKIQEKLEQRHVIFTGDILVKVL
ncbi:hypothetical protein TELCIR_09539 [Teladorsagia circumcincta]|uniref:Uncharacterized protein n=1 Tax=Teladorsagia circumcincta TaxID=45464 RepID=A0A2G9UEL9_TELCI|nr:hypothetical protein TELCIR_09539 [Teladorsagia circumcincta]